jgi:hypothetical protein
VELQVLPAWAETPAALSRAAPPPAARIAAAPATPARDVPAVNAAVADDGGIDWPLVLLALWSAGLVTGAIIDLRRLARTRRLICRSRARR